MNVKPVLEDAAKTLSVLTDLCKFLVLAALSAFAIAAIAHPEWARQKLKDAGLSVREINVLGVKLAADETFDMAKAAADAKLKLQTLKSQISAGAPATDPALLTQAIAEVDKLQASLAKQNEVLKDVQEKAGAGTPPVPDTGWIFVGRVAENKTFTPGPRIDGAATKLEGDKVVRLQIRSASPVIDNGDECVRKALEEIQPPSEEDLRSLQMLLVPDSARPLEVLASVSCPSAGNGRWVYAKIRIPKEGVKFVKYETVLRR